MEKCAYCGEPVGENLSRMGDELFCSEDCMDRYETGDGEDTGGVNHYTGEESAYDY